MMIQALLPSREVRLGDAHSIRPDAAGAAGPYGGGNDARRDLREVTLEHGRALLRLVREGPFKPPPDRPREPPGGVCRRQVQERVERPDRERLGE